MGGSLYWRIDVSRAAVDANTVQAMPRPVHAIRSAPLFALVIAAVAVHELGHRKPRRKAHPPCCGVTQPRINDLLRGRVSRFSLDALVNIATAMGRRVHLELEAA
jgi:Helix-turn-helix domain